MHRGLNLLPAPPSLSARSLLAYLCLHKNQFILRDVLLGTFWPERSEGSARKALSQALWQVRCALGAAKDRLETDGNQVLLSFQQEDWLDVAAFEEALQRCRKHLASGALPAHAISPCLTDLGVAVELYRGSLVDDCYDDWIVPDRERLLNGYLWGLEKLILLNKQWGDYEQALAHAQRLVAVDPLRESAHCELMRLYNLLGRPRDALEQYASLCALLEEELGDEPGAAATAIYRELIAAGDEHVPAYLPLVSQSLGNLDRLPFTGRSEERATLLQSVQAAARGQGGIVLLEGPAGVGKTRLVDEVTHGAEWRGLTVAVGHALPEAASPYQPLVQALSILLTPLRIAQLAEMVDLYHLGALVPLFPHVAEVLPGLPFISDLQPAEQQERLWNGLSRCLEGLGMIAPLMLVLEDLHWAQPTLNALKHIAARLEHSRVLLLLTCRMAEARQQPLVWEALEELDRLYPLQRVSLSPLSAAETAMLLRRALPVDLSAPELIDQIWRETGGYPLLLVETLKSMLKQGTMAPGLEVRSSRAKTLHLPPNDNITQLTAQRLAWLMPAQRQVLEVISILGEQLDFAAIARVTACAPGELIPHLAELERMGFLRHSSAGYHLGHELVRQGINQSISQERRQLLHLRAAEALQWDHPERVEALAHHYELAGERRKALEYALRSAQRARASLDYQSEVTCLERALLLVDDPPARRWEVLAQMEQALDILGHRKKQEQVLEEMLNLSVLMDDVYRQAETLCRQGKRLVLYGQLEQAVPILDRAAGLARAAGARQLHANCLVWTAYAGLYAWDIPRCQAAAQAALHIYQERADQAGECLVQNLLGNFYLGLLGHHARALACFDRSRQLAAALGNRHKEISASGNMGGAYSELGCYQKSVELLEEAIQFMAQIGDRFRQGIFCCALARSYLGIGELEAANLRVEDALRIFDDLGNENWQWQALEALGMVALELGDLEAAQTHFERSLEMAVADQEKTDISIRQAYLALVRLHQMRLEEAASLSTQAVQILAEIGEGLARSREVYFIHFQVLSAGQGRNAARSTLELAHRRLMEEAASIEDAQLRNCFMTNISTNHAILAAWESGLAPPITIHVRLPSARVPANRSPRPDELIKVCWTLICPQDSEVSDRVRRRQGRLLRLLAEAQAQSAAAPLNALARVLNVDQRTIKRDLAALRAAGRLAPGRRRRPSS